MKATCYFVIRCLAVPLVVHAQETTGDVRGRVRSTTGPVVNALVTATSEGMLGTRHALVGKDGFFTIVGLPPGLYTVRAAAIGHRPVVVDSIRVQLGLTTPVDLAMESSSVQLTEVRIVAPPLALDPARTTIGATLEAAELASLPAERDFQSLMTTLPHVNRSHLGDAPNSGGSTGLENMYFVDGVNVTSPLNATRGTALPYNFVRSVQVRSGGYEAQYGRALGAIVNAVTYTGSNTWEANAFGFFTNDGLAAVARSQPSLKSSGAYSYDIGARVSGPLIRDRLWLSSAFNPRITHVNRAITTLGTYPDHSRTSIFAGKLTWQAARETTVELSVFGDPAVHHEVRAPAGTTLVPLEPDPYLVRSEDGGVIASLRAVTAVGRSLLLEASFARSDTRDNAVGDTKTGQTTSPFLDFVDGIVSGGALLQRTVTQGITSAVIRGTFVSGAHRLVVGGEYDVARVERTHSVGAPPGRFMRTLDGYILHLETADGSFRNLLPTGYAQDSWRVTDRLTVNGGLRWSRQTLEGTSGDVAQRLSSEWQPRAGFSALLDDGGRRRVFGSYGRFYQQQPLNLASLYYVPYVFREWYYDDDPRIEGTTARDSIDLTSRESDFAGTADGATSERFDEYTAGYEQVLGGRASLTLRLIHRHLGTAFQQGVDFSRGLGFFLGTPGEGELYFLPRARRDYTALEVSLTGRWERLAWRGSYVLSRAYGNHVGLFGSDLASANPGVNHGLSTKDQGVNSTGLLPNDRPHVLKVAASLEVTRAFSAGMTFHWQSGTPMNAFGVGADGPVFPLFLFPRGSIGRLPADRDLSIRLAHETMVGHQRGRVVLDVFHIGNPQTVARVDQYRYRVANTAKRRGPLNPNFLRPVSFTPPAMARLGVEISR